MRGRLVNVQGLGQQAVPHGQDHLDDPGDPGRGLGVADVGLERAEPERPVGRATATVGGDQGLRLDRVAEGRAGAVRLDGVDVVRGEAGRGQRGGDDPLLGGAVGGGQPVGGPVLVDRRPADNRQHGVAVALGVRQSFQGDKANALAPAGAVGGGGK